ncbi:MAG TPA: MBL fold hydrolase, partial [Oribacterium sp.]|nr:MBL fold hydrolase [Oribacterium sp.]
MNPAEERHPYDCLAYRVSEESLKAQKAVLQSVGITPNTTPFAWRTFM